MVAILGIKQCRKISANRSNSASTITDHSQNLDRNHGFDRRTSYIEYTEHAKCRMACRHISQSEVEEIMKDGSINYRKSNGSETPCPVYALEGVTHDDQRVRIVYAQCDTKTKVVTVIDLDTEWECHCPGDDDKHKNTNL
jgi:hypothetical protein